MLIYPTEQGKEKRGETGESYRIKESESKQVLKKKENEKKSRPCLPCSSSSARRMCSGWG
jgi:hypothetical protein